MSAFQIGVATLLLGISPVFGFTETPNCIAGDPTDLSLVNVFNDEKNPDNGPIRMWREEIKRSPRACETSPKPAIVQGVYRPEILELAARIRKRWAMNAVISSDCVAAAMKAIDTGVMKVKTAPSNGNGIVPSQNCAPSGKKGSELSCPTDAYVCSKEKEVDKVRSGSAPCVTNEMAEYIAWILTKAISCFSPEDDPLDARLVFRKLNNESQFGFFVRNRNGRGLNQLVPIAEREMLAPERAYNEVLRPIQQLLDNPATHEPIRRANCEPFREVLKRTPAQPLTDRSAMDACMLLQPGIGVARSAMLGVGTFEHVTRTYFLHVRGADGKVNKVNTSANQMVLNAGLDPIRDAEARELRDLLSLAYYSSAGPNDARVVFEQTAASLQCEQGNAQCSSTMLLRRFQTTMSDYYKRNKKPDYFVHIANRYRSMLQRMDGGAQKAPAQYSPADLRGDRCVD